MLKGLLAFFHRKEPAPPPAPPPVASTPAPPPPAPPPPSRELEELTELVKKLTRAQTKLGLRVDELAAETKAGFAGIERARPEPPPKLRWDDLLDAMDRLEHASSMIDRERNPGVVEGLSGVLERLASFLARGPIERVSARGELPDGRLFRVVGTEEVAGAPPGTVTRVVRSAAREGERVVREGEVMVQRGPT